MWVNILIWEIPYPYTVVGTITKFSNTPKLKIYHTERGGNSLYNDTMDCENQLRIGKVMIFIVSGIIVKYYT